MKKFGFTLAEILITMGIIGVVAALTAPTLVNNAANAQIRPTLAKVVSTLENANLGMMNHRELNSLAGLSLDNYLNGNQNDGILSIMSGAVQDATDPKIVHLKGNIDLIFSVGNDNDTPTFDANYIRNGGYLGSFIDVIIDIDGNGNGEDALANDQYQFMIDASGTVLPYGGMALHNLDNNIGLWSDNSSDRCNAVGIFGDAEGSASGRGCAGSVFENNDIIFR